MRLIVVSNRLPVTIKEKDHQLEFSPSAGGLATGLRACLTSSRHGLSGEYLWAGWPGGIFAPERHEEIRKRLQREHHAFPIFLSEGETEKFYEGFCNNTLWPLCHYFPTLVEYNVEAWQCYEHVNRVFRDALLPILKSDDVVWVHDYHFMLLPRLLREMRPELRIGYFLHIPFPSYEIFRLLPRPWRSALLNGMLGADLIGFHTHDYTQHFLKSVRRIQGLDHHMGEVALTDRVVKVDTFPMGIEFDSFAQRATEPDVAQIRDDLRQRLGDSTIVLSIDRLDYTKGIDKRLLAFEMFLHNNPAWHGRVTLVLVVVPSRIGVEEYRRMKSRIDELVGEINGRFGTLKWTPVLYQFKNFDPNTLVALYSASEVMLVTPLRDGMNLVAKEYAACRTDGTGVLILSEMAGAASELGEALEVNPNDVPGMADTLLEALEMPRWAQEKNMAVMRRRLKRYDVVRWAQEFLEELLEKRDRPDQNLLTAAGRQKMIADFHAATKRLILCDYDGTLVPIRRTPREAVPDPQLLDLLRRLSQTAEVVVISGRDRATMDDWFRGVDITLVGEHGMSVKEPGGQWTGRDPSPDDWKPKVRDIMELYVDRLPGALVEEKEFGIAWHYRRADPDLASLRVRELVDHLISLTENSPVSILEGHKVVEVRPSGVNKGAAVQPLLGRGYDFILALGDDVTDDDMFKVLPDWAYSVRVGLAKSFARYNVLQQRDVIELLTALAAGSNGRPAQTAEPHAAIRLNL
jgi:trehalose 6-phosphate synthase/phosphatase